MADTQNSYSIGFEWVDLNTVSSIPAGTPIQIQNTGLPQDIIVLAVSAVKPLDDFKGVNLYQKENKSISSGGNAVWAKLVRIDKDPSRVRTATVNIQTNLAAIGAVKSFNQDFLLAVSKGIVPGHRIQYIHSYCPNINTSEDFIWPLAGVLTFDDTPGSLWLTSSNDNDDQNILVTWLDSNWDQQTGLYKLNGQTPVEIGTGLRVNEARTLDSSQTQGDIYISNALTHGGNGVPTQRTTVMMFEQKTQTRSMASFSVPRNHTAFGLSGYFSTRKGRDADFLWNVRNVAALIPATNTNVVSVYQSTVEIDFKFTRIPQYTDAWFTAESESGSGRVSIRIPALIVDNNYLDI